MALGTHLLSILISSCFILQRWATCLALDFNTSRTWPNNQNAQGIEFSAATGLLSLKGFDANNFTLAFRRVSSSPELYTLGVFMPNSTQLIWEANRDAPVQVNATLTLSTDGDLALSDSNGALVWSTGTANLNATTIELLEPGNLVILANESVLWQSFQHPTDALVEGQVFGPGMKLETRSSQGIHSLVMEPDGLVLYSNFSGAQEPYWIRAYRGQDTLVSVKLSRCGSDVSAVLERSASFLELNMSDTCNTSKGRPGLPLRDSIETVQNRSLLRLEPDGNLRLYTMNSTGAWNSSFELFNRSDSCKLPGRCQPFGICSNGECVSCVNSDGARTPWSSSCKAPVLESCTDLQSLEFLQLPGLELPPSSYLNSSSLKLEDCRMECLRDCSCAAFFFWEDSNTCFMTSIVSTLSEVGNQTHVAYIKAPRGPGSGLASGATAGIVVGCLLLALLVIAVPVVVCLRKRRKNSPVDYDSDHEHPKPVCFSYSELEQMTENFSRELGNGVYEGTLGDGKRVAVKDVEKRGSSKKKFLAEVSVVGRFHHWNLEKLVGYCSEDYKQLLVYEHLENGSLEKWIYRDSGQGFLEWELRMGVMLGVARALAYLHDECVERIVHLDVKPQSILLDSSFVAKLSELGKFRRLGRVEDEGFCSPELARGGLVTDKSDVYSFGVVLLEVVSGLRCWREGEEFYLPAFAMEMVERGREKDLVDPRVWNGDDEARSALGIAFQCLQEDPSSRPSMRRVVGMLEGSCEIAQTPRSSLWKMPWV